MNYLLVVWLLAHGVPGAHAEAMAPCIASSPEPFVMLGIMHRESRYQNGGRSGAGACSYFGLLGGRYGAPHCSVLERDPALACATAVKHLGAWKEACGDAYLDGYNGGWFKCWTRPNRTGKKCWGRCDSYSQRVLTHAAFAEAVLLGPPEGE